MQNHTTKEDTMKTARKTFLTIVLLISATGAALAYMGVGSSQTGELPPRPGTNPQDPLTIDTSLTQKKVLQGSDGNISVALTLTGADISRAEGKKSPPVDLVVVLDRSGSMQGQKIEHARQAVTRLIEDMDADDRIGLITYSNQVETLSPLVKLNNAQRERLVDMVRGIVPAGGTNLGSGLQRGINTAIYAEHGERLRKVILVSDGLANQGVTSVRALGAMAAGGTEYNLGITTIGVGYDFNEILMTTIADHGGGNYHFLENPSAFSALLKKEFETTRNVVAGNVELRIQLKDGVQLLDAGGYPIRTEGSVAIIRPGDIMAGQQRTLFLSYRVPTGQPGDISLGDIDVQYQHNGEPHRGSNRNPLLVACVTDEKDVIASIEKKTWAKKIVKEEYSKLKDSVAAAIRSGRKQEALSAIDEYKTRTGLLNSSVESEEVSRNLDSDVVELQESVQDTFAGAPAAVAVKQKQQAKELQYDSYRARRDKQ
jgi:Ca-activated chloride channel family protein